ncbi:hypothetical protein CBS63078_6696 [Aspergillus niger]|uniref:Hsp20/alpha crystallin family protein n=3 Tax=Aspergillus niger TaxID=5061 RepID=A0A254UES1_ASPNG|nr:hypothetical protein CBS115989_1383 [Aspergillus niger]KAI2840102.1 hypothetical protein CBS11350_7179 [Aspergillus niger]KAI2845513.1 hypothetical protein CBS12448_9724 [Aspergillus niger]KAI2857672.1 hypothetical protein CBS11232_3044 [Aspergillus niger]KAI2877884.1 hypothetical protein CBS115988_3542 [Aspergillus niger]
MTSAAEQYRTLVQTKGKVAPATLSNLFDQLPPLKPEQLLGSWNGGFFDTGHSVGPTLQRIGWIGKDFNTLDDVDPVIVLREGRRASWGQWGHATVREMVFRGVLSTVMIYDDRPIFDHFRYNIENMSSSGHGQHVLLTGANGFVASHILSILLDRGYTVTATVRSQAKADEVVKAHPDWKGKIEFAIVSDFTSQKPFNTLFEENKIAFDYVIHTASPLKFDIKDIQKEMIEPAVKGTTQILESAHQHGGSALKRFILLGSAVSVLDSFEDMSREGRPYTEKSWNPVTAQQAIERNDTVLGYNVSKTQAERKAWEFMQANNPNFDLTVINPDIITGPMIHPITGKGSINETNHFAIASFIDGTNSKVEDVRFPFYHFVDVRDVARSHVDALSNPAAGGQRILLISGLITPQLVVNIIRKHFSELREKVPVGIPDRVLPEGVHPTGWDMRVSLDVLSKGKGSQWQYIGLEESVKDAVQSMLQHNVLPV